MTTTKQMADPATIRMTWGMNAGRTVASLGNRYLAWLSGKGSDLKPDELREAVRIEIQRRTAVAAVVPLQATDDLLRTLAPGWDEQVEQLRANWDAATPGASDPTPRSSGRRKRTALKPSETTQDALSRVG
jgi:uncharacterized protein (DUF3820 family)